MARSAAADRRRRRAMNQRAELAHDSPQPGFVAVGGRRLRHLITRGTGDAVVLVHGFGGSLENCGESRRAGRDRADGRGARPAGSRRVQH